MAPPTIACCPDPPLCIEGKAPTNRMMDDDPRSIDDAHLWSALREGRPAAFAAVMDRYGARLLAHALAVSGNRAIAEDAVQDALLRLVQRPFLLAEADHPAAYLARMVRNRTIDLMRRESTAVPDGADPVFVDPASDQQSDQSQRINAALAQLPAEQREVVVLKIFHGLTFAAIAPIIETSANTAASRYRYALDKLSELLKESSHDT